MPKTKEEILADIAKAVEGQGNQGAIAIAPILKDIVELAAQGGGGTELPYELVSITISTNAYGYVEGSPNITADDAAKLKVALDDGKLCIVAVNINITQSGGGDYPNYLDTPAFVQARKEFTCPDSGGDVETYNYGIYVTSVTMLPDQSIGNQIFVVNNLDTTSPQLHVLEGMV